MMSPPSVIQPHLPLCPEPWLSVYKKEIVYVTVDGWNKGNREMQCMTDCQPSTGTLRKHQVPVDLIQLCKGNIHENTYKPLGMEDFYICIL